MSDSIQRSAAVLYQMEEETPGLKESAQALVSDTMLWPALNVRIQIRPHRPMRKP